MWAEGSGGRIRVLPVLIQQRRKTEVDRAGDWMGLPYTNGQHVTISGWKEKETRAPSRSGSMGSPGEWSLEQSDAEGQQVRPPGAGELLFEDGDGCTTV